MLTQRTRFATRSPGHVLCRKCCNSILEKTPSRLTPNCPFCRETFSSDNIRLIRIDFNASRYNTPRYRTSDLPAALPSSYKPLLSDLQKPKGYSFADKPFVEPGFGSGASNTRTKAEVRRLEEKVATLATKKCSVEEVSTLHDELQSWLHREDEHVRRPFAYLSP